MNESKLCNSPLIPTMSDLYISVKINLIFKMGNIIVPRGLHEN